MPNYLGKCNCGTIVFECEGDPIFTQYCHCNKCREIAALSNRTTDKTGYAFTAAYLRQNFHITAGESNLESIVRNNSKLLLCSKCKSLIYGISLDKDKQAGIGISIYNFDFPHGIPDAFKSVRHLWYVNRVVNFNDDLPKFKDAPKGQGGTGELA